MTLVSVALAVVGHGALRYSLDRQINASLLSVASIQAASVTDGPTGEMHFHEWDLTPAEALSLQDLNRYAQVWDAGGQSILRSQFLVDDLPLDDAALARALKGELVSTESVFAGVRLRSYYYPLERLGLEHTPHVLQVAAPLAARDRTLKFAWYFLFVVVLVVGTGTFLGSSWLGSRAIQPIHQIIDQTEEIRAGTLGRRISAHADTLEYERLVGVLNTMLARIDAAFEAQRRFTADASHELRSPLTALRGELELALRRERSPEEYRRVMASGLEETERLSDLAENLLALARSDAGVMHTRLVDTDIRERVAEVIDRIGGEAETKNIRLTLESPPEVWALCDPGLIDRLVWNLLDNAVKFTTPGGRVEVSLASGDGSVILEVADTGPGIRQEPMERVFERFNRGDVAHGGPDGAGLGLSMVQAIAETHGGRVSVENRDSGGARFTVTLPKDAAELQEGAEKLESYTRTG